MTLSFPPPDIALAGKLFGELAARTRRGAGIVRDSYGPGEQAAHDMMAAAARALDLEVARDAAANLYLTLPGRDRAAPRLLIGSHLDSVPQGGNYDGAAGVVAGLAMLAGFRQANAIPSFDIAVMGVRAEEAAWFDASYVGSYAAFGQLDPALLDSVRRSDSGRSLAEHMTERGCDVAALRRGEAYLDPERLRGYIELHIEQGPVLEGKSVPVGVVTGIRGCLRFRHARCHGAYGHSGAQPRQFRRDAVAATVELLHRLNRDWVAMEEAGHDLNFTTGELTTDPAMHGPSKIAGETRFVLDFRSVSEATMQAMRGRAEAHAAEIGPRLDTRFELGPILYSAPAVLDSAMRASFAATAGALGLPFAEMASGAGHDAAVFANNGVPTGMLFVRNAHGSHNPDEAMDMADFAAATRVLAAHVARDADLRAA